MMQQVSGFKQLLSVKNLNTREQLAAEEPELVDPRKEQKGTNIKLNIQQVDGSYSAFEVMPTCCLVSH